jgi:hypothetical protein
MFIRLLLPLGPDVEADVEADAEADADEDAGAGPASDEGEAISINFTFFASSVTLSSSAFLFRSSAGASESTFDPDRKGPVFLR